MRTNIEKVEEQQMGTRFTHLFTTRVLLFRVG